MSAEAGSNLPQVPGRLAWGQPNVQFVFKLSGIQVMFSQL